MRGVGGISGERGISRVEGKSRENRIGGVGGISGERGIGGVGAK